MEDVVGESVHTSLSCSETLMASYGLLDTVTLSKNVS